MTLRAIVQVKLYIKGEDKKMYRNMIEISKVPCPYTRAALWGCEDPGTLETLMNVFPQCFSEKPQEQVAWQAVYEKSVELCLASFRGNRETAMEYCLHSVVTGCSFYQIPIIGKWSYSTTGYVPKYICEQLLGQNIRHPMFVKFQGLNCVVVHIPFPCGMSYRTGMKVEEGDVYKLACLKLAPRECFVFDVSL